MTIQFFLHTQLLLISRMITINRTLIIQRANVFFRSRKQMEFDVSSRHFEIHSERLMRMREPDVAPIADNMLTRSGYEYLATDKD